MTRLLALIPGLRALTPLGWLIGAGVGIAVLAVLLGGLGFRWDPLDLSRRRLERAERSAEVALAEGAARAAQARGEAGQVARLDSVLETGRSLGRATFQSIEIARTADDASAPLPYDRADRLRDHDRQLCRLAPGLAGCAAAPSDPADAGEPTL